jgi:hypothetical protein
VVVRDRLESREILKTVPFHVLAYLHNKSASVADIPSKATGGETNTQEAAWSSDRDVELMYGSDLDAATVKDKASAETRKTIAVVLRSTADVTRTCR